MNVVQKKICMLGDFAVGKTSLVRRFVDGRFDDRYLSTIGVKLTRKTIERSDHRLNLILWDLAGGDDFMKIPSNYLIGLAGAILVCDLTRHNTLRSFARYAEQVRSYNPTAPLLFVANKADLENERSISDDNLRSETEPLGETTYFITSAKTGTQVEAAFEYLVDRLEV